MKIREAIRVIGVRNGEVLLIRHANDVHWNLPGGGIENGESVTQTVTRELEEELSLSEDDFEIIHLGLISEFRTEEQVKGWDGQNNLLVVVNLAENIHPVVDGDEVVEFRFGSLDMMVYEDLRDDAKETLQQAKDLGLL
jgi:8-oxo-dGTP pyrophosphatase MutT (NUDIX family)